MRLEPLGILPFFLLNACTISVSDEIQRDLVRRIGELEQWRNTAAPQISQAHNAQQEQINSLARGVAKLQEKAPE